MILDRVVRPRSASRADIDRAATAAREAFDDLTGWSRWSPQERAEALERFALALNARAEATAHAVSSQNGMPIRTAQNVEAVTPPLLLRYSGVWRLRNRKNAETPWSFCKHAGKRDQAVTASTDRRMRQGSGDAYAPSQ
ncbi:aldehyde dehydrogenase family protein (plasmid) [Rhodococcus sp. USK10]|nr:aldehyde dehydrogenase family protein [Rhodococcus sp. USK10]